MAAESEKLPLGRMVPPVPAGTEVPPEPPDVMARQLSIGGRLLCGAITFFFMSFLFAYFYLRSLNIENQWRPHGLKPDQALGGAFVACLIVSMALSILASAGLRRRAATWIMLAAGSVVFGLIAIALQCIEYTQQNFGPTNGAFASVFCGWTAWQLIVMVMGVYWLETIVATELRARRAPAAPHGDAAAGQVREADRLIAPGIGAAAFFWTYLGALGVIMYVVLYIV